MHFRIREFKVYQEAGMLEREMARAPEQPYLGPLEKTLYLFVLEEFIILRLVCKKNSENNTDNLKLFKNSHTGMNSTMTNDGINLPNFIGVYTKSK